MAELTPKQLEHNRKCMPLIMEYLREGRPWFMLADLGNAVQELRGNMDRKTLVRCLAEMLEQEPAFAKVIVEAMMRVSMAHMKQMLDYMERQGEGGESPQAPGPPESPL